MLRWSWLWILALQLAVPSLVVLADAATLGPQPTNQVHIEVHDSVVSHPADCGLCTFLRTPVEVPDLFPTALPTTTAASAPVAETAARSSGATLQSPLPRGPPSSC
jgi:hypothetical protein